MNRQFVRRILKNFPTAVAVWYHQPFFCVLNPSAVELTGFSQRDFQQNESLWPSRIDPRDQVLFSSARRKLQGRGTKVTCDYRFVPNGGREAVWIRDVSVPFHNRNGRCDGIVSVYMDISGLVPSQQSVQISGDPGKVVERLAHDLRNCVHVIGGGFEVFQMTGSLPAQSGSIISAIQKMDRLVLELEMFTACRG